MSYIEKHVIYKRPMHDYYGILEREALAITDFQTLHSGKTKTKYYGDTLILQYYGIE